MALGKSIFHKESYSNAIDKSKGGQYGIKFYVNTAGGITNNRSTTIEGILKESIKWGVNATWDAAGLNGVISAIASSNPVLDTIDKGLDFMNGVTGRSFTNTGIFTRKFYSQSGDLKISPSFRVMDFNNEGLPVSAALIFSSLCIPKKNGQSLNILPDSAANTAKEGVDNLKNAALKITAPTDSGGADKESNTENSKGIIPNVVNALSDQAKDTIDVFRNQKANWSVSPSTVDIDIGGWLSITDMVLTDVGVEFSMETSVNGPIYADFNLTLVTRENLVLNEDGTMDQISMSGLSTLDKNNTGRVSYGKVG
jgi:hypothetical protein